MAGLVKKRLTSGKYRAWYMDWTGKQVFFTGTTNPKETQHMAERLEDRHRRIRVGDLPPPKASDTARPYQEVASEYLEYGKANGGHGGRPWSTVHLEMRSRHILKFWPERLHLTTLQEITLPKVEAVARELLTKAEKTGKTVQMHVESIKALCLWAKGRGYLDKNPLEGIAAFDCTPKTTRRALTVPELVRLLEATPPDRRLIYETAVCTGYRKGELTALRVQDLDVERCTLKLAAAHSKGRKDSRQPISAALAAKLRAHVADAAGDAPLFNIDFHIDRLFTRDLDAAKIPITGPGGKLVFHSLRHTYCTLVIETGASLTEAQRLLRHIDPRLTANVYSHARQDRLQSTAEAVGAMVIFDEKYALSMQKVAVGSGGDSVSACAISNLSVIENGAGEGVRTRLGEFCGAGGTAKVSANKSQSSYENGGVTNCDGGATVNVAESIAEPFETQKYALSMHLKSGALPPDVMAVVNAWPELSAAVKARVLEIVAASPR